MLDNETVVTVDSLVAEVERLRDEGARMITATGLDEGDHFDVLYHFDVAGCFQHLRLSLAKEDDVPSISQVFPGAFLIENEMKELLGIRVVGISVDYGGKLFLVEGSQERPLAKKTVAPAGAGRDGAREVKS